MPPRPPVGRDARRAAGPSGGNSGGASPGFLYAAHTWAHERDVVRKVEHGDRGPNPRFLVATLSGFDAGLIYDRAFCPRRQSENYIKDLKNALCAERLS